jgi:hypothetical protein
MQLALFVTRRRRHRASRIGASLALLTGVGVLIANASGSPTAGAQGLPFPSCQPEQYPPAGAPRNAASVPYEIPFSATLGPNPPPANPLGSPPAGGYLEIANSVLTVTLGGPVVGTTSPGRIYGTTCGLFQLPTETGGITANPPGATANPSYNNNFLFDNPIPISLNITGVPGLPVLTGYGAADGDATASIDLQPAANGGLNVEFYASAKATSDFGPALSLLPASLLGGITITSGNECTIPIGDLRRADIPAADLQVDSSGVSPVTGLTFAEETTPTHLTSGTSGSLTGQPITGPITASQATLVSNDFWVGKVDPNTPPAPAAPSAGTTPSQLCTASSANLLNGLLGLPSPPGKNIFYAPSTFAIHTSA